MAIIEVSNMEKISNKRLLCMNGNRSVFFKRGKVYFEENGFLIAKIRIPLSKGKEILSRFEMCERMFRLEPKLAIFKGDVCFFSCHGAIYQYMWGSRKIVKSHLYRKGMNNPICFFELKDLHGFQDGIMYGEYWGNRDGEKVSIYQMLNGQWVEKYSFPRGEITHIHGFVKDTLHDRLLILTGDFDEGSGIWEARDDFAYVKPLLVGRQQYRSCVAFACETGILYATDTPLEENAIYFFENGSGKLSKIKDIPGPCIYGRDYIDESGRRQYMFATTVEPDSRITGIKYLLTYKLGPGVKNRKSYILAGNEEDGFREIFSLKKDWLPMGLFQFGNIQFPDAPELICVPQAVKKYAGKTIRIFWVNE